MIVRQNVKASRQLFSIAHVRDFVQRHIVKAVLLCKAFLTSELLSIVPDFVPLLFVLLSQVFLHQSILIFHLHVYWVVHQAIAAKTDKQISTEAPHETTYF